MLRDGYGCGRGQRLAVRNLRGGDDGGTLRDGRDTPPLIYRCDVFVVAFPMEHTLRDVAGEGVVQRAAVTNLKLPVFRYDQTERTLRCRGRDSEPQEHHGSQQDGYHSFHVFRASLTLNHDCSAASDAAILRLTSASRSPKRG